MSLPVHVLYQDENIAAFYKPSGFHVHPHENPIHRVSRDKVLLYQARDLLGKYVYPVHRLDAGTSGVILFALSSSVARELSLYFQNHQIEKTYEVVVRGIVPEEGTIDLPLELDSTNELVPARTDFTRLSTMEFPVAVGKRNPTARYSLVRAFPRSGRYHQIRRHFGRKSHPVLGDAAHGDSKHNRFFREELLISGLCLRASQISLSVSWLKEPLTVSAPICQKWQSIYDLFHQQNELRIP
jgi:tRNA pseudouridine65 synthase